MKLFAVLTAVIFTGLLAWRLVAEAVDERSRGFGPVTVRFQAPPRSLQGRWTVERMVG